MGKWWEYVTGVNISRNKPTFTDQNTVFIGTVNNIQIVSFLPSRYFLIVYVCSFTGSGNNGHMILIKANGSFRRNISSFRHGFILVLALCARKHNKQPENTVPDGFRKKQPLNFLRDWAVVFCKLSSISCRRTKNNIGLNVGGRIRFIWIFNSIQENIGSHIAHLMSVN